MSYSVPPLPYGYDALEPHIDEQTMRLHHDKHHQAYVDKANDALAGTEFEDQPVEEVLANLSSLPSDKQTVVRNNGGGHANHTLFWESMNPAAAARRRVSSPTTSRRPLDPSTPSKSSSRQVESASFGSGWTWLVLDGGELKLETTANQDSPILAGHTPLLGNDVWEHAYYLTYQNRRPEYLKAWWNVVDWDRVAERYAAAKPARAGSTA